MMNHPLISTMAPFLWALFLLFVVIAGWYLYYSKYASLRSKSHPNKHGKRRPLKVEVLSPPQKSKPAPPPLERKKEEEKERPVVEKLENPHAKKLEEEREEVRIVGVTKVPKSWVWTQMIINEKLGYLLTRLHMSDRNSPGYWTNLIKMQRDNDRERNRGKSGRGR